MIDFLDRWLELMERLTPWERRFVAPCDLVLSGAVRWSKLLIGRAGSCSSYRCGSSVDIGVQRITTADIQELANLDLLGFSASGAPPVRYEEVVSQLKKLFAATDLTLQSLVIRRDGIVAAVLAVSLDPRTLSLSLLIVRPDYRRRGLARGIVSALAGRRPPDSLLLSCVGIADAPAQGFFMHLGFRPWCLVGMYPVSAAPDRTSFSSTMPARLMLHGDSWP
jgi:ribosomal protein S18 acetylase RimI-like enzyme